MLVIPRNVKTEEIGTDANSFFARMKKINDEFYTFVANIPKSANLEKAIERKG